MGRIKTFAKYIIWLVAFYLFAMLMMYIGLNSSYKNIELSDENSEQIKIDIAQATKVNGRIYGEITSTEENNLNDKYIKVQIYNKKDELIGTKYLKIENTVVNEPKKFIVYFSAENIEKYSVDIVENAEKEKEETDILYKRVFTDEELKQYAIIGLLLWALIV